MDLADLQEQLSERLSADGLDAEAIDAREADSADEVLKQVAGALGGLAVGATAAGLVGLMQDAMPPGLLVSGVSECPSAVQDAWLGMLTQWALASKQVADLGRTPCPMVIPLVVGQAPASLPLGDLHLEVRSLWGLPSALEVQVLCRVEATRDGLCASTWREHVLPAVVGDDVALLDRLWDAILGDPDDFLTALNAYAEERKWTSGALSSVDENQLRGGFNVAQAQASNMPPGRLVSLWRAGLIGSTAEYGIEVHPAALMAKGQEEEARHRLWRGQVRLLLPFLDSIRLTMCQELTQRFESDWPCRVSGPQSDAEAEALATSPLTCDYGRLEYVLRKDGGLRDYKSRWHSLVARGKDVRNSLAHYRPVSFSDYEWLDGEARRVRVAPSR
jgi:hypothetical protein